MAKMTKPQWLLARLDKETGMWVICENNSLKERKEVDARNHGEWQPITKRQAISKIRQNLKRLGHYLWHTGLWHYSPDAEGMITKAIKQASKELINE
jgi:hypothetical protein